MGYYQQKAFQSQKPRKYRWMSVKCWFWNKVVEWAYSDVDHP